MSCALLFFVLSLGIFGCSASGSDPQKAGGQAGSAGGTSSGRAGGADGTTGSMTSGATSGSAGATGSGGVPGDASAGSGGAGGSPLPDGGPVDGPSPRVKFNFNIGWKFIRQDVMGAEASAFNDAAWANVSTPHTFNDVDTYAHLT